MRSAGHKLEKKSHEGPSDAISTRSSKTDVKQTLEKKSSKRKSQLRSQPPSNEITSSKTANTSDEVSASLASSILAPRQANTAKTEHSNTPTPEVNTTSSTAAIQLDYAQKQLVRINPAFITHRILVDSPVKDCTTLGQSFHIEEL